MTKQLDPAVATAQADRRNQRLDRARPWAAALTVIPVWVAVLRTGLAGIQPSGDAALTALRSRDVLSTRPPLVGMVAAGASNGDHLVHFPGPWQLYVLGPPTRLLGAVWGPIVAMGALNTIWVLLACWLLCRRLDTARALVGMALLAVLLWSLGSGMLITPVPMDMIAIPFITFLIAVWSVATGDLRALPVLAAVASFLWLDHLILIMMVPVLTLVALIGLGLWILGQRRLRPDRFDDLKSRSRRALGWSGAITFVMWLPTLIQQFTTNPGNLSELIASGGEPRTSLASWTSAIRMMTETIARPPFWFRGSFTEPGFRRAPIGPDVVGDLSAYDVVVGFVIVASMIALGVIAHRRADRVGLWALIIAAATCTAGIVNIHLAPITLGQSLAYLRWLPVVAMFVWLALALNILRRISPRISLAVGGTSLVVLVLAGVMNLPTGTHGYGTSSNHTDLVRQMNTTVPPMIDETTPILLRSGFDLDSHAYFSALALRLADIGTDFCVKPSKQPQMGHPCNGEVVSQVTVLALPGAPEAPPGTIWSAEQLTPAEQAELDELDRRWTDWLQGRDRLELSSTAAEMVDREAPVDVRRNIDRLLAPPDGDLTDLQNDALFRFLIDSVIAQGNQQDVSAFVDAPLTGPDLIRWYDLVDNDLTVFVIRSRPD